MDHGSQSLESSSKGREPERPVRRFAPVLLETTAKSTRLLGREAQSDIKPAQTSKDYAEAPPDKPVARRFAPQPVETSTRSSRKGNREDRALSSPSLPGDGNPDSNPRKTVRRFAPQLVESARRRRRSGDQGPTVPATDRTEASAEDPDDGRKSREARRNQPVRPLYLSLPTGNSPDVSALKSASSPGGRSISRGSSGRHSFQVPGLEPIESSESDEASLRSVDPSQPDDCDDGGREASGHVLLLAAERAERQLRAQAMAAFVNHSEHQPIYHYVDHSSDESERQDDNLADATSVSQPEPSALPSRPRRTRVGRQYYRSHRPHIRQDDSHAVQEKGIASPMPAAKDPWANPAALLLSHERTPGDDKAVGLDAQSSVAVMRKHARPPMLGKDMRFPRCASPTPARFDVTQGRYIAEDYQTIISNLSRKPSELDGLWQGTCCQVPVSPPSPQLESPTPRGLWGGRCVNNKPSPPPRGPTGLMTPCHGLYSSSTANSGYNTPSRQSRHRRGPSLFPPSPPHSSSIPSEPLHAATGDFPAKDEPKAEQALEAMSDKPSLEQEYPDSFVTQVYNYLSLGYPSLARTFDEELSKISGIPVSKLRQDDDIANITPRGYIRLGTDESGLQCGVEAEMCVRWRALRRYIHEWARQLPAMSKVGDERALGGFGVGPRRGSWAW